MIIHIRPAYAETKRSKMTISRNIARNIIGLLASVNLPMEWLEKNTGISVKRIREGRSFTALEVFRIAASLDATIGMLIGNEPAINFHVPYRMSRKKADRKARKMYNSFWDNVTDIAAETDMKMSEIAEAAVLSNEKLFLCCIGFDTEIERLQAVSQYLDIPIDRLTDPFMAPAKDNILPIPERLAAGF